MNKIENFDQLSLEKQKLAKEQFEKYNLSNKNIESATFFKENGWLRIKNFVDEKTADFLYHHIKNNAKRLLHIEQQTRVGMSNDEVEQYYGSFGDSQIPKCYSNYGNSTFDDLCDWGTSYVSYLTGINLVPTYSYHRLYTHNAELTRHKDRGSCEISTTLYLGSDISNLEDKNYKWPMWVLDKKDNKFPIDLDVGDMIVYRGCDLWHWREKFEGVNHAQVFLHYNEKDGELNNTYDGRDVIGLPAKFKDGSLSKEVDFEKQWADEKEKFKIVVE